MFSVRVEQTEAESLRRQADQLQRALHEAQGTISSLVCALYMYICAAMSTPIFPSLTFRF
jgi:hypothetical protein